MSASSAILRKVRVISHSIEKTYSEEYPFYFLISVSFAILFYEFKFVILSTYISYKFQKIYLFMKNLTFSPVLLVPLVSPVLFVSPVPLVSPVLFVSLVSLVPLVPLVSPVLFVSLVPLVPLY